MNTLLFLASLGVPVVLDRWYAHRTGWSYVKALHYFLRVAPMLLEHPTWRLTADRTVAEASIALMDAMLIKAETEAWLVEQARKWGVSDVEFCTLVQDDVAARNAFTPQYLDALRAAYKVWYRADQLIEREHR